MKSSKSVKSFIEYKIAKGKQWYSKVKGGKAKGTKTSTADQEVLIYIGLLDWNEKENVLKPKRGKKVALRISNSAKSSLVRQKAEEKWKAYYRNLYEENQRFLLHYEDGQQFFFCLGQVNFSLLSDTMKKLAKITTESTCTCAQVKTTTIHLKEVMRVRMKAHLIRHQNVPNSRTTKLLLR